MGPSHREIGGRPCVDRAYYDRGAEEVAKDLIGRILVVRTGGRTVRARIVETEAYVGSEDLACHASKGKTPRNAVMFGPPGFAYVYLVYGMHHMLNLVTASEGDPQAVLIRALEPLDDAGGRPYRGPGVLCRALGITRDDDGSDLCGKGRIHVEEGMPASKHEIVATPRIGVDYARAWKDAPLRFCLKGCAHVSGSRRIPR